MKMTASEVLKRTQKQAEERGRIYAELQAEVLQPLIDAAQQILKGNDNG